VIRLELGQNLQSQDSSLSQMVARIIPLLANGMVFFVLQSAVQAILVCEHLVYPLDE
jgi:hypothetical protein